MKKSEVFRANKILLKSAQGPKMHKEAFRRWFGESAATNDDGEPLVLYHGTAVDIAKFRSQGRGGLIYFTACPLEAGGTYAEREYANQLELCNPEAAPVVYPVYVRMERPFDVRNPDHRSIVGLEHDEQTWGFIEQVASKIEEAGFDGVLVREEEGGDVDYAVFRPEQIKSAIGNDCDFDPTCPDLCDSTGSFIAELEAEGPGV